MQHVTYNEWLPLVLGVEFMEELDIGKGLDLPIFKISRPFLMAVPGPVAIRRMRRVITG